jgi:hypothetical protein
MLFAGCAAYDPEAIKRAAREGVLPDAFPSQEAAQAYTGALFAGGRVDPVRIGSVNYMVVIQHGSGVPLLGIGVYRKGLLGWRRVEVPRAPRPQFDFVRASEAGGKIILTEQRSRRTWILYDPASAD